MVFVGSNSNSRLFSANSFLSNNGVNIFTVIVNHKRQKKIEVGWKNNRCEPDDHIAVRGVDDDAVSGI